MVSASREMVSRIMRDLGVGGYLESRSDEIRRPLPGTAKISTSIYTSVG